jgi:hypothetical protein
MQTNTHLDCWYTAQRVGNRIGFHPQVKGGGEHLLLGPLERAKLNHWTLCSIVLIRIPDDG